MATPGSAAERSKDVEASTLLVLGGTGWLSGLAARHGVERGLDVTCLARGSTGTAPDGVTWVRADRTDKAAYDEVAGRDWDVVLDVSWQPALVRPALAALGDRARHWVYVSSVSVYADGLEPGSDESAALFPAFTGEEAGFEDYPVRRSPASRPARTRSIPSVCWSLAPGFSSGTATAATASATGPREPLWLLDGEPVLTPPRERPLQVLDAEDLARWLVSAGTRRRRRDHERGGGVPHGR